MKNFVCWDPEHVNDVVNIDADFVPDSVFWAIDTENELSFKDQEGEQGTRINTDELVARILDPRFHHFQLAVLGPAGVGKSHLIHRIRQRILGREGLEVVVVRRLETNLRAILDKLVERLPIERREKYRDDLERSAPGLASRDSQMRTLLDCLAQAVQEDVVTENSGIAPETEAELIRYLPQLLSDPYLRQEKFLKDGQVIPELVDRLFSNKQGKRVEESVEFTTDSLPLHGVSIRDCSLPAREALAKFTFDRENRVRNALTILNRNLRRAITRAHNFGENRLSDLMEEIRRVLKSEGKELVLLFEEFARLQGYDAAMLEALLIQGNDERCNVRWAIACTSGRFRELPDTIRSRMNAIVDMETDALPVDISEFAGKYLNAVREGRPNLELAYNTRASKPNFCISCEQKTHCHKTFGFSREGYGLYPFTASAIRKMAIKADANANERFNPRGFQRDVLRPVLLDGADALKANKFPTKKLLDKLGGPSLDTFDLARLKERAKGNFERYLTLVELWNDGSISNLPEDLLSAFDLKQLELGNARPQPTPNPPPPSPVPNPTTAPNSLDLQVRQLNQWVSGGSLDQALAQTLKEILFEATEAAIDWDKIGLLQGSFAGAKCAFRPQSIQLSRQETRGGQSGSVKLEIPANEDESSIIQASQALQAMLLYQRTGDWDSSKGIEGLAVALEFVEVCAVEVVRQISSWRAGNNNWDPIGGAVELLLVGSALSGDLPSSNLDDVSLLDAIFKPVRQTTGLSNDALSRLYNRLRDDRKDFQDLVRAHSTGSKGARKGSFINPVPLLTAARNFRDLNWQLSRTPGDGDVLYDDIREAYEFVAANLPSHLTSEFSILVQWLNTVERGFGTDINRLAIIHAVEKTIGAVAAGGLALKKDLVDSLNARMNEFMTVDAGPAISAVRTIKSAVSPQCELPSYGQISSSAIQTSTLLLKSWQDVLDKADHELSSLTEEDAGDPAGRAIDELRGALENIIATLQAVGATDVAS
jgi:hypothetical protein